MVNTNGYCMVNDFEKYGLSMITSLWFFATPLKNMKASWDHDSQLNGKI